MKFNGITNRNLKRIDNQRIKELKGIHKLLISSLNSRVLLDTTSVENKLDGHKTFAEKRNLTGKGGHATLTKKQMDAVIKAHQLGIEMVPEKEHATFEERVKLYLKNLKATENIKRCVLYEREKLPKIIRYPLNIGIFYGGFKVTQYFWTNIPTINELLNSPDQLNETAVIKTAGVILGVSAIYLGFQIKKKIEKIRGVNRQIKAFGSRKDNPMFSTVSYLTAKKRKQALRLIAKSENLLEQIKIDKEEIKEREKTNSNKRREQKRKEREIRKLKRELKEEKIEQKIDKEIDKIFKELKKEFLLFLKTTIKLLKIGIYSVTAVLPLIPLGAIGLTKLIIREIEGKEEKYQKNKAEEYLTNLFFKIIKKTGNTINSLFN